MQDEEEWAGKGLEEVGGPGVGSSQNRMEKLSALDESQLKLAKYVQRTSLVTTLS